MEGVSAMKALLRVYLLVTFALLITFASTVWAQATAQIHGTVQDASGSAVPGAEVKATQTKTGVSRTVSTGAAGGYALTNLPVSDRSHQGRLH
jgi:Carboxypeptidase regulatory-like domain